MDLIDNQLNLVKKFVNNNSSSIYYIAASSAMCFGIQELLSDYAVIDLSGDYTPFKPFLNVIADCNPSDKLLDKHVFSIQKETFKSFFENKVVNERHDIPVENETIYEKNRYTQTILSLIKELHKKNILILNAQNIFSDTIEILLALEKVHLKGKFVFCFNSEREESSTYTALDFLEDCHNKKNFLFLQDSIEILHTRYNNSKTALSKPARKGKELYNQVYQDLKNNRIFMAFDQLKYCVNRISKTLFKLSFNEEQKRTIYYELGMGYFTLEQKDEAIMNLSRVLDEKHSDELETAAMYYISKAFYLKKSSDMAKKYSSQMYEKIKDNIDSPYYALGKMMDFQFSKRSDLQETTEKYLTALDQLEKHNYINNYISTGLSIPWDLINHKASLPMINANIEKCYKLAKKIDNQHLVSKACHWKGIMLSHYGKDDEAMKWYNECNAIRTKIGEITPIINIRNGLSYESVNRAEYEEAYNIINDVIKNLYNMSDYSTVIDTLKNTGYALFYARNFDSAYKLFTKIQHYLTMFDMASQTNNSFLPSLTDMLVYKTIIDMDKGDYIHGQTYFSLIYSNVDDITSEDKPLVQFIQAVLYAEQNDFEKAEIAMEMCIENFMEIRSNQSHKIIFCCYEYAHLLKKLGKTKESELYLQKGFNIAKEKNYSYYTKGKNKINLKDYLDGIKTFAPLNIDLAFLDEKAEKELLLTQMHKRIHDYQFLNKIKSSNLKTANFHKYIENALLEIFEYTLADAVAICENNDRKFTTIYKITRDNGYETSENLWKELFKNSKKAENGEFIYNLERKLFFGNISQLNFKMGIIVVPGKRSDLTSEIISTLNLALSTLQSQIIIYKQEENLLFLSSTDQLSLLKNRHALQEHLIIESERIKRHKQRKRQFLNLTIAFIDMDHFKYYNDHFGHSTGDELIKDFAELLRKNCRQVDFIARFGGDEFVVIMDDTSFEEAINLYKRLTDSLKKEKFFIPDIKEYLERPDLEIPKEKYLGFSMGIATNADIEEASDLNMVMSNADKALYYAKEHNRGSYSIWSDIKEKL